MRARGFSDYDELWRWSVEDLDGFWGALWDWFEIDASYDSVLGSREMPGAEWFPGAQLNYAEHLFRGARPGETAIVHASESEPLARADLGRARGSGGALRRRAAAARGRARRPRRGLHAERARDGGGVPGLREHRRGLVELRARVRHADRRRPLQADRAEGADRHRGLPLRREGLRPSRAGGRDRGRHSVDRAHGAGAERLGRAARRARRADLRARAVRPPALGPLLVRHDGAPEGDRPGTGRHPAGAPEEDAPPRRPRARRPLLLVHHHRLDDVELPGRRAPVGRGDRALRRAARSRAAVAVRRRGGRHLVWDERRASSPRR